MPVTVLCVATHSERLFPSFIESLQKQNFVCVFANEALPRTEGIEDSSSTAYIMGWQQKWEGFAMKFRLVSNFVKSLCAQGRGDDIIVFLDSFDTVVLASPEEIESKFLKYEKKYEKSICFSVDDPKNYSQLGRYTLQKTFGSCAVSNNQKMYKKVIINTGGYIGRAQAIYDLFLDLCGEDLSKCPSHLDDQLLMTSDCHNKIVADQHVPYNADTKCAFFFNVMEWDMLADVKKKVSFDISGDRVTLRKNSKIVTPCFYSGPGGAKIYQDFTQLGLTPSSENPNLTPKQLANRVKSFSILFTREIVISVVIIWLLWSWYKSKETKYLIGAMLLVAIASVVINSA